MYNQQRSQLNDAYNRLEQHVLKGGKLRRDHPLLIKLLQCRQAIITAKYTIQQQRGVITTAWQHYNNIINCWACWMCLNSSTTSSQHHMTTHRWSSTHMMLITSWGCCVCISIVLCTVIPSADDANELWSAHHQLMATASASQHQLMRATPRHHQHHRGSPWAEHHNRAPPTYYHYHQMIRSTCCCHHITTLI